MKVRKPWSVLLLLCVLYCRQSQAELFSLGAMGLLTGASVALYKLLGKPDCSETAIPFNPSYFRTMVKSDVFGQPLVLHLYSILQGHKMMMDKNFGSRKALSISLNGWPGTGKNYVAGFLAEALFTGGLDSPYVKLYIGRNDFAHKSRVKEYQDQLKREIKEVVSKCGKALIIFDEVNDIVPEVLDVLQPLMDFHPSVDGVDYRNVIFLFLSNINGNEIAEHMLTLGKARNSLSLADFDEIMRHGSYDSPGGLKGSSLINSHLIDHYIPFLPLEEFHVRQCVTVEFRHFAYMEPTEAMIKDAMEIITYGPPHNPIYANAGCKRVKKQVSRVAAHHLNKRKS